MVTSLYSKVFLTASIFSEEFDGDVHVRIQAIVLQISQMPDIKTRN